MTETGKQLAPMETFMERVKGKLRDDIGALLPDEAVQAMVEKVVNDEFFTKKTVRNNPGSYHDQSTREVPSEFQRMVMDAAKPILERKALELVAARAPELEAAISEAMNAGLMKFAMMAFDKIFSEALGGQEWRIQDIAMRAFAKLQN